MNPETVRKALVSYLAPKVEARKGHLSEAGDWDHAGELLGRGPGTWSVILGWEGYDSLEDGELGEINSLAWSGYYLIVERSKGMAARPGKDVGNLESLIAQVIAWMRALVLQDEHGNTARFEFRKSGWEQVPSDKDWRRHLIQMRLLTALSAEEAVIVQL